MLFSGCPCVRDHNIKSLATRYLMNCLSKFHQIYNLGAFGDKDEQTRFLKSKGQRSKVRVTKSQKHFGNFESHAFKRTTFPAMAQRSTVGRQRSSSLSDLRKPPFLSQNTHRIRFMRYFSILLMVLCRRRRFHGTVAGGLVNGGQ